MPRLTGLILKATALLFNGGIETAFFPINCVAHAVDNLDNTATAFTDVRADLRLTTDSLCIVPELHLYVFFGQRAVIRCAGCISGLHVKLLSIDWCALGCRTFWLQLIMSLLKHVEPALAIRRTPHFGRVNRPGSSGKSLPAALNAPILDPHSLNSPGLFSRSRRSSVKFQSISRPRPNVNFIGQHEDLLILEVMGHSSCYITQFQAVRRRAFVKRSAYC